MLPVKDVQNLKYIYQNLQKSLTLATITTKWKANPRPNSLLSLQRYIDMYVYMNCRYIYVTVLGARLSCDNAKSCQAHMWPHYVY